jgi:hypothetical protein
MSRDTAEDERAALHFYFLIIGYYLKVCPHLALPFAALSTVIYLLLHEQNKDAINTLRINTIAKIFNVFIVLSI